MASEMGTIIHTDGKIERREFPKASRPRLQAIYAAIGGGCRLVACPSVVVAGRALGMYCDDDGLYNGQPINLLASSLYGALIVGTVGWKLWSMHRERRAARAGQATP